MKISSKTSTVIRTAKIASEKNSVVPGWSYESFRLSSNAVTYMKPAPRRAFFYFLNQRRFGELAASREVSKN